MLPFDYKDDLKTKVKTAEKKKKNLKTRAKQQALANQILVAQAPQATQAQMSNGQGATNA